MKRVLQAGAMLALAACAARPEVIEPLRAGYRFQTGEVLVYEVKSRMNVSMEGSHSAFLINGNSNPLTWTLSGIFENVVMSVDAARGQARLERRVRRVESSGQHERSVFGFEWDCEKHKTEPDQEKMASMDRFVASMISSPVEFGVNALGTTSMQIGGRCRLVGRMGMMYWPVHSSQLSWTSKEEMAVPLLHDLILIAFRNTLSEDQTRGDSRFRLIRAIASMAQDYPVEKGSHDHDVGFVVTGGADVELDLTNGRLQKLDLNLTIRYSSKVPLADGGEGDIKGIITYLETQVLID